MRVTIRSCSDARSTPGGSSQTGSSPSAASISAPLGLQGSSAVKCAAGVMISISASGRWAANPLPVSLKSVAGSRVSPVPRPISSAVQAAIVSLAHYYEIHAFRSLQPITATAIPPLAWAALQFSAVRRPRLRAGATSLSGSSPAVSAAQELPSTGTR